MYSLLEQEMNKHALDWIIISGKRASSPDILYFTQELTFSNPIILIKKGEEPIFIHELMESEEALQSPKKTICRDEIMPRHSLPKSFEKSTRNFIQALAAKFKISGKVLCLGSEPPQKSFLIYETLSSLNNVTIAPHNLISFMKTVREIKSVEELKKIKRVSLKTVRIFKETVRFLKSLRRSKSSVLTAGGETAKLGHIRDIVNKILAEERLISEEPPIISMGSDAASPHMRGNDRMEIAEGAPIVMDISPKSLESGYHSDMTRTFALGEPSNFTKRIYRDVKKAYEKAVSLIKEGESLRMPDETVHDFFISQGYETIKSNPNAKEGYIHSLGHGIGLEIHEEPLISRRNVKDCGIFRSSTAFTIEPGLYYKSEQSGVRLEDSFCINEKGNIENLTEFPMTLSIETEHDTI